MPNTMRCTTTVLAMLALAFGARAQDPAERREAVEEFKRYFRRYRAVDEQVAAVHTLERAA